MSDCDFSKLEEQKVVTFEEELADLIDKHYIEEDSILFTSYIKMCLDAYNTDTETESKTFKQELSNLINRYSLENDSDTPDFILARYLKGCLDTFNATMIARDKWCLIDE